MSTEKGFTVIEVLAAMFFIIVGAGGALALIVQTTSVSEIAVSRLTASYLAQEGIEVVRNMRDTNFIGIHKGRGGDWKGGRGNSGRLLGCEQGCEVDYNDITPSPNQNRFLMISDGLYQYDTGEPTPFVRKITITSPASNQLDVVSEITWSERGRTHTMTASTKFFDWLTQPSGKGEEKKK